MIYLFLFYFLLFVAMTKTKVTNASVEENFDSEVTRFFNFRIKIQEFHDSSILNEEVTEATLVEFNQENFLLPDVVINFYGKHFHVWLI